MQATQRQTIKTERSRQAVTVWLWLCLALVALMIVVGGLTRLTESGLSIVEWEPITGTFPPATEAEWESELANYKTTPQAEKIFPDITVEEFKRIYWLEYAHRLLGRLIGAVFIVPLIWFAATRAITPYKTLLLFAIFALGGAQGLIGWYMVQSGLVDAPYVSPYRLALHLGMGFVLFACILWQALSFGRAPTPTIGAFMLPPPPQWLKVMACITLLFIFLQVIMGAFVAGLHAGLTYNTFPHMDGKWIPDGLWPNPEGTWYSNLLEDVTTVQWMHRVLAYMLSVIIPVFWIAGRNNPHVAHLLPIMFAIFVVQFLLGVLTLLFVVPIPLASLHQTNALLLFGIAVTIVHRLFLPLKAIAYDLGNHTVFA
jgi:heme a synthase